ncbi:MAG: glycosyltransferase family protein [Acidiphilium sp.]
MPHALHTASRHPPLFDRTAHFQVVVVRPPGYPHSEAFREVAAAIFHGMRNFGVSVTAGEAALAPDTIPVIFGANLLSPGSRLPTHSVIFNLEQIGSGSVWVSEAYLQLLARHTVWDYSLSNIEALIHHGVTSIYHVPIGYVAALERIPLAPKDIDVLFYGSMNARRQHIIEGLRGAGVNVVAVSGIYGAQRDALIARARIVLNVHYYESKIFEIVRVFYLLANAACVISEDGLDPMEQDFASGVEFVPYDQIIERCRALLSTPQERARLAVRGQTLIRSRPQERYIARLFPKVAA